MTGAEIVAIASLTSAGVAAYSSYQQGQQQKAWSAYNARVAEREAQSEREAARFESQQQRRQAKMLMARQRSLVGASGVEAEGSPLLVMEDTAEQLAIENAQIRKQGANRVQRWRSQAILDRMQGKSAAKAGMYSAGASLLSGASDAAYKYKILTG